MGERSGLGKDNGRHVIHYDDNTKENEDLRDRSSTRWEFLPDGPPTKKKKAPRKKSTGFDLGRD